MDGMPEKIWMRDDQDDGVELTDDGDPCSCEYIRADIAEQQLAAERERADALDRELQGERYHRQAVERSEQALAAHVDRLHSALTGGKEPEVRYMVAYAIATKDKPETSLAHRDARVAEWVMKSVASGKAPAEVIAEIESGGGV